MFEYDVVYIKGNPNSGTLVQHEQIDAAVMDLIKDYSYKIIESHEKNIKNLDHIPKSKIYIGFSRGSRYLNKLNKTTLKISIGGITGSGIHQFVHENDYILKGDISKESMNAHFLIAQEDKNKIHVLIRQFLEKH
mgnify:CR=1 FL=1